MIANVWYTEVFAVFFLDHPAHLGSQTAHTVTTTT